MVEQRQRGQAICGVTARTSTADLALLHALIGLYARQLDDVQHARIAMDNRARAARRTNVPAQMCAPLAAAASDLVETERAIGRQLVRLARQHVMSRWIAGVPGVGLLGFARLLGTTGPLDRFATVPKLWAYLGMHVVDGSAPRRRRGQRASWSARGRVVCHQLGVSIVRARRGRYREAYDRKKAEYLERDRCGPSACPFGQAHTSKGGRVVTCGRVHAHRAAMRYAVKMLLKDLWCTWQAAVGSCSTPGSVACVG